MTQENEKTCGVFEYIKHEVAIFKDQINTGNIEAISAFSSKFSTWFRSFTDDITACATAKTPPTVESYTRNKISDQDDHVIFVHSLKKHTPTSFHNHGRISSTIFILPITDGLVEENFLHNITDFSSNIPVNLYHVENHRLNRGEVYLGSNNLIHRVSNPTDNIQTFMEIYLPIPKSMKIYLPFYNTQNLYLPLDPITTNLPYYKALHNSVSAKTSILRDFSIYHAV
jgi:hypothetical protein